MIIKEKISVDSFGAFVKVVVDAKREILSADCELHLDCAEEISQRRLVKPRSLGRQYLSE